MTRRGVFITFEGGEGAGKTSLIGFLKEELKKRGKDFLLSREPGGTALGEKMREVVLHQDHAGLSARAELALFLAARAQHVEEVLQPALFAGKIVLCDRFSDSSVAYQGYARGLGMREVRLATNFFASDLVPDLTFYLDAPPEVAFNRVRRGLDRIEREKMSFHEKVREGFFQIAQDEPARFHIIDATKSKEEVQSSALLIMSKYLI